MKGEKIALCVFLLCFLICTVIFWQLSECSTNRERIHQEKLIERCLTNTENSIRCFDIRR